MNFWKKIFVEDDVIAYSDIYKNGQVELSQLLLKFDDDTISEMHIQNQERILITDQNGKSRVEAYYNLNIRLLIECCAIQSNTRIDPIYPIAGGTLPGKNIRWHAALKEITCSSDLLNFRVHRFSQISMGDFSLSDCFLQKIQQAILDESPILIYGATGSGKTSFLNAILIKFFSKTRLGIIETIPEIELASDFWFRLVSRPENSRHQGKISLKTMSQELLRLRPERIVVGEIRGDEAISFLESSTSGHGGAISTIHASVPDDAITRLIHFARGSNLANPSQSKDVLKMFSMHNLLLVGIVNKKCVNVEFLNI